MIIFVLLGLVVMIGFVLGLLNKCIPFLCFIDDKHNVFDIENESLQSFIIMSHVLFIFVFLNTIVYPTSFILVAYGIACAISSLKNFVKGKIKSLVSEAMQKETTEE